jgi:hypothetical protein
MLNFWFFGSWRWQFALGANLGSRSGCSSLWNTGMGVVAQFCSHTGALICYLFYHAHNWYASSKVNPCSSPILLPHRGSYSPGHPRQSYICCDAKFKFTPHSFATHTPGLWKEAWPRAESCSYAKLLSSRPKKIKKFYKKSTLFLKTNSFRLG